MRGHGSPKSFRAPSEARQGSSARIAVDIGTGMLAQSERVGHLGDQQHSMPVSKSGDTGPAS
jgi:hypothetical protein